jgi:hypothetical protein
MNIINQDPVLLTILGICIVLLILLSFIYIKYSSLRRRYQPIIDAEAEEVRIRKEAEAVKTEAMVALAANEQKIKALNQDYTNAKALYDKLKLEISLLEEDWETIEHGIYKPHYNFKTSEEYKSRLEINYKEQKELAKDGNAVTCANEWSVGGSKKDGKKMTKQYTKLMLRAFNGECDSAIVKVAWNNVSKMEERIKKAYESINEFGSTMGMSITSEYLQSKLGELHLYHEKEVKEREELEEQRRIREQMREEEKVQSELERAQKEAEDEEQKYEKALAKARAEIADAKEEEVDSLNTKIQTLQQQLEEAHKQKERALSQAQLTRAGYVYIISNIGSFGEDAVKIGMTRRLEPLDRIRELSDASVPFEFDIHAMIYSEDAPGLECILHNHFEANRINLVNYRKEFFKVSLDEIQNFAKNNNLNITITKLAEAREYRETIAIRQANEPKQVPLKTPSFPESLDILSNQS